MEREGWREEEPCMGRSVVWGEGSGVSDAIREREAVWRGGATLPVMVSPQHQLQLAPVRLAKGGKLELSNQTALMPVHPFYAALIFFCP